MSSPPTSSFDGAHMRERHSSSNSTSSRPHPSSSSSSLPSSSSALSSSHPTTHPISLDALIAQHANAPNPSLAALDQALSERNLFSAQNTQLWKLIEKQRTGYSQVLKELERMRSERDAYKSRLHAAGLSVELAKKERDKPKSLRSSASNATISSHTEGFSRDPRAAMVRRPSDTSGAPNDDRPPTPQDFIDRDLHAPHLGKYSMPHAIAPPRSASLPQGCSTAPSNHSSSSSSLLSSRSNDAERAFTRPPVANNSALSSSQLQTSSIQPAPNSLVSPHLDSVPSIHGTPHSSSGPGSSLLSPIPENSKSVGIKSTTSLPDEAKHLGESSLQRSGLTADVANFRLIQGKADQESDIGRNSPTKLERVDTRGGDETEFLDMDEEEDGIEESEQQVINGNDKPADTDNFSVESLHSPTQVHRPSHSQSTPSQSMSNSGSQWSHSQTRGQSQSEMSVLSQSRSSLESTPLTPHPDSPSLESYLSPTKPTYGTPGNGPNPTFRALPLIANDLKTTRVTVSHSSIRPNDRGKEVLSFEIEVDPGKGKEPWKVEKLYSDVLGLDHRLRAMVGKGVSKKIAALPEGKLWRDHAPAKSDQRKAALEVYLQSLIDLPVKNKDEVIAFLTSDVVRDAKKPVMQAGHKEGYLTKRGKNFGGWKTRYFVLQGPVLEYYESRGGTHLGSIVITNAQIGRQQRTADNDDEKNYRHAFLIIEAKKAPGGPNLRHVLCAESDSERDNWVDILVRYVTGTFNEDSFTPIGPNPILASVLQTQSSGPGHPRSSVSSNQDTVTTPNGKRGMRVSKDDISRTTVTSISQLAQDTHNAKLFQSVLLPGSASIDESYSSSPTKSIYTINTDPDQSTYEEYAKRLADRTEPPLSSSLPTTSPLDVAGQGLVAFRSSSELGHYTDIDRRAVHSKQEHESGRSREVRRERKSYLPGLAAVSGSPTISTFVDRASSPDVGSAPGRGDLNENGKVKISGPLRGAPIPAGYKFGGKDAPVEGTSSDRREKAKSRSFWNFGRPADKPPTFASRAVFGVPLDESLDVAEIARLPAVIFRCIQYLEAKKADQEEGIYRLSGSSAVIKGLKDRFNSEGDVDLLVSDEYWDPHAIAGLLKGFLRELPASILTRDLHMQFLSVMDFVEPQERIHELSHLVASLPIANYSLLRALTAHLISIVQNAAVNKMTMRNVGIVFSPTLGIPAGVFSLMLGEFNRVFNVDAVDDIIDDDADKDGELSRRNSRQYSDAAADQLLGLSGRSLHASTEETPSEDSDTLSIQYESGNETTENDATVESGQMRLTNPFQHAEAHTPARGEFPAMQSQSHAAHVAASRGLNIAVTKRGNRHSRVIGLPVSPRLQADAVASPIPSPLQTAKQS